MTVHLIKLCVGCDSVDDLRTWQRELLDRARAAGQPAQLRHVTRHRPRRGGQLADGGSLYWVIQGMVQARQRIVALERTEDGRCALILDEVLVATVPRRHRPFQGWRYLQPAEAPPDLAADPMAAAGGGLPSAMAAELRALGLL